MSRGAGNMWKPRDVLPSAGGGKGAKAGTVYLRDPVSKACRPVHLLFLLATGVARLMATPRKSGGFDLCFLETFKCMRY